MRKIADIFEEDFQNGYYVLIDHSHPLQLYVGKDGFGHYSLEYRGNFKPLNIPSSGVLGIKQYASDDESRLLIFLKDDVLLGIFCAFCDDIVKTTAECENNEEGYDSILNRIYLWRKMFLMKKNNLTESEIIGLLGELTFLREYMIPKYGEERAIESWSGQDKTHKDFSIDVDWYEVKSTKAGKETVKISSLEQLSSDYDGQLVVYQFEKMSPAFDGIKLNSVAHELYHSLTSELAKDQLLTKFVKSGFDFSSEYDAFVFQQTAYVRFLVNKDFPRLSSMELPHAIAGVQYELLLSELEEFKIQN